MYILLEVCQNPGILRVMRFILILMDIVFTLVPIGLIIMLLIDLSKVVISGSEDDEKNVKKLVPNRLLMAVLVFAVPYFVGIVSNLLVDFNGYNECISNAKDYTLIEYFQAAYDTEQADREEEKKARIAASAKEKSEKSNSRKIKSGSTGNEASGKTYKEAAEKMIKLGKQDLGSTNGVKYLGWDGAWCAAYVKYFMERTTIENVGTVYSVFNKNNSIVWPYRARGTMEECIKRADLSFYKSKYYGGGNYTPKVGDIIYFNWKSDWARTDDVYHVGFVDYTSGNTVHTLEGNSGKKVSLRTYDITSNKVIGYCSWYK